MSLKKVEQVKKDSPFRLADLIIYGVIAVFVAVLLIVLFVTRAEGELKGVRIYVQYEAVFEYEFKEDRYAVFDDCAEVIDGEIITVKISLNGGYNIVQIDKSTRRVCVSEADCRTRDCVRMPAIVDGSGIIYCSPHRVRIEPYDFRSDGTVIM